MCEEKRIKRRMDDEMFDGCNERDDAMSFMVAFSFDDVLMYEKILGDHFLSNTFSSLQYLCSQISRPLFVSFGVIFPSNDPAENAQPVRTCQGKIWYPYFRESHRLRLPGFFQFSDTSHEATMHKGFSNLDCSLHHLYLPTVTFSLKISKAYRKPFVFSPSDHHLIISSSLSICPHA